ncbi:hypothetical protein [Lachnoclostridium edouardi]|uniref:hypothetical protein n=1 Tax=Lachnoclostridium edouardi TaxID=1926283 RepID=UPI0015E148AF|nr:hypothetical protein [Lachnoclostridium edouardi]MDO4278373.1 hypothetical protein [Lachnoclostridium edouardi]
MDIIFHFPKDIQAQKELARQVADVHGSFILEYIQSMTCPGEEKSRLLHSVLKIIKETV